MSSPIVDISNLQNIQYLSLGINADPIEYSPSDDNTSKINALCAQLSREKAYTLASRIALMAAALFIAAHFGALPVLIAKISILGINSTSMVCGLLAFAYFFYSQSGDEKLTKGIISYSVVEHISLNTQKLVNWCKKGYITHATEKDGLSPSKQCWQISKIVGEALETIEPYIIKNDFDLLKEFHKNSQTDSFYTQIFTYPRSSENFKTRYNESLTLLEAQILLLNTTTFSNFNAALLIRAEIEARIEILKAYYIAGCENEAKIKDDQL